MLDISFENSNLLLLLRLATIGLLLFLIVCCAIRQRRYWRELQGNRPSTSLRFGYRLAIASAAIAFTFAAYSNTPEMWKLFGSIVLMLTFFCLKISFSPSILAAVLIVGLVRFEATGALALVDVWIGVSSALMWRFPEEVRVVYATISFIWVMCAFLRTADITENRDAAPIDVLNDSLNTLGV